MIRVRCQQHVTIDAKGRLALPAPIRRAIDEMAQTSLVLTFAQGAVWAWTADHYESDVEGRMMTQDPFEPHVLDFAHSMMSTAQDCEIDKQGRIRIPPPLRELAGLTKDCVVHVLLGKVEIWDREAWDRRFEESLSRTAQRGSGMPGRYE
ncbi:MAG: cell division/cell wall cluster transcriptional repressor MraZ [Myxococcota bacterium]